MSDNKVSILIPCYNSESFIRETLESCLSQSYRNIEIIIVDDGSTDDSLKIAKEYESKFDNIFVFSQNNKGACSARNLAFEKSSGDYIIYLDADDVLSLNKIEYQVKALLNRDVRDIATCRWDRFQHHIEEAKFPPYICYRDYDKGINLLIDLWNYSEMFQTSCYLISRQLVIESGVWNESLKKNQDGEFFARVLLHAKSVVFCENAKVYYRSGDYESVSKGSTKSKIVSLLESFILYKTILNFEDSHRVRLALAKNFALFRYLYHGQYPDLSKQAKEEIMKLKIKSPIVGTARVKKISSIIGFENFLRFRKLILHR